MPASPGSAFRGRAYHLRRGHPPTRHLCPTLGEGGRGRPTFHLHELTLTAVPESTLEKSSRPHHPKHGPVSWQDAALAELLTLGVIGRYSRPSAKECGEVSPWYGALKYGETLWMPEDCLKEHEKNV